MPERFSIPGILSHSSSLGTVTATALECGQERLNYEQLADRVLVLASSLHAQGVQAGTRVALAAQRDIDSYTAMLALLALGAAYVPLDLDYPPTRIELMLDSAEPDYVLGRAEAMARLPANAVPRLNLDSRSTDSGLVDLPKRTPESLAYVLFTSGSTGTPKGVAMPRAPLSHLIDWHVDHPRLGVAARTLAFAPMSFDVHFQELHSTLATGGTLVLLDDAVRRDPARLLDALEQHRIERLFVPYIALQMLADTAQRLDRKPTTLRDVVTAGEALRITPTIRALFRALPHARLHNHYGPTESHVVTALQLADDPESWPEQPSIGKPLPHVKLALRRPTDHSLSIEANEGELLIGGHCLADGYIGQPALTAQHFVKSTDVSGERWYASGDLARQNVDNTWDCLGRVDMQTKIDGFRVEPAELELALLALPEVRAAAVDVREIPRLGRQLLAWVVPDASADKASLERRLRHSLSAALPDYMQPARIQIIDALPQTPSGKIDVKALPVLEPATSLPEDGRHDPLTRLVHAWAQLLGRSEIDPDSNVFELGARSLTVVRLLSLLAAEGLTTLEVADIYSAPTARGQALRLADKDGNKNTANPSGMAAADSRGARQRAAFSRMRPGGDRHG